MSTLKTVRSCHKSETGVTVVELLVAVVIMGLVALLVSVPAQMTQRLSKTALDAAMDTVDSNLALRALAKQISSSQIVRSGLIKCTGKSAQFFTQTKDTYTILGVDGGDARSVNERRFTVPYSPGQTIGSISKADSNRIQVTDTSFLQKNDLVALVNTEDSSKIGAFRIAEISKEGNKPYIIVTSANTSDLDSDCSIDSSVSLSTAEMVEGISSAGQRGVFVQSLAFANYKVEGTKLLMQAYPRSQTYGFVAFDKLRSIKVSSWWYGGTEEGKAPVTFDGGDFETEGTFISRIDLVLREASFVGEYDEKGNAKQGSLDKTYSSYARYVMTATKKMNKAAVTNAVPQKTLYPTCYVVASNSGFVADPSKVGLPVRQHMIRLTGKMSDSVGAYTMQVGIEKSGNSTVTCMNQSDWLNSGKVTAPKTFADSDFVLTGSPTTMDVYLCSAKGKIVFTGTVSYFDKGLGKTQTITCKDSVGSTTVGTYTVKDKPSCKGNIGSCNPGSIYNEKLDHNLTPNIASAKCEFSPKNDSLKCCEPIKDPNYTLTRVHFVPPEGAVMDDPTKLTVNCN